MVSVCCITYNHEKYIAEAIESFIMQKTDFPIEIIIHDDASTDNTPNIIKGYEKKHPDLIKPIYQVENKHSKGRGISSTYVWPKAKGKYIALCEGDDYWNDPYKLQKQINFMENAFEYSMCFHAVEIVNTEGLSTGNFIGPYKKGNKSYSIKDNVKGGFIHISSLLMRTELVNRGMPDWYMNSRHGDYALVLYLSANGKVYFIDEIMSSYRTGVENSIMTNRKENYTKKSEIEYFRQRIATLEEADKYYNYNFHDEIEAVNLITWVHMLLLESNFKKSSLQKYKKYMKQEGMTSFIKLFLLKKAPKLARLLVAVKGSLISRTEDSSFVDKGQQ